MSYQWASPNSRNWAQAMVNTLKARGPMTIDELAAAVPMDLGLAQTYMRKLRMEGRAVRLLETKPRLVIQRHGKKMNYQIKLYGVPGQGAADPYVARQVRSAADLPRTRRRITKGGKPKGSGMIAGPVYMGQFKWPLKGDF